MSDSSYIHSGPGGLSFVGPDAVRLYQVCVLISALRLHQKTGILSRGATITKVFAAVTALTGKTYKRKDHAQAIADLEVWREAMKAALPIIEGKAVQS